MRHFRISIDVDITAANLDQADRRLSLLISDLEGGRRRWIVDVLPNGMEERIPLPKRPS